MARETVEGPSIGGEAWGRIIVLAGDRPGRRLTFAGQAVLGRARDADVEIGDPRVSRLHARLVYDRPSGDWVLQDLGSRNGTLVDGRPIDKRVLRYGERFRIGESLLLFTHHDALEDQLGKKRRLEALGRMGAGIAHDLNNMLEAIRGSLEYIAKLDSESRVTDDDVRACHRDIALAVESAGEMTSQLVGFAKGAKATMEPVPLASIIREVVPLVERACGDDVRVHATIDPGAMVHGNRAQLHQVLMNLCKNACEAMGRAGRLRIDLGWVDGPAPALEVGAPHVCLRVTDDGPGMDAETLSQVFDPFFTTKSLQGGTGLGLANVYEIIRAHGGSVDVESTLGQGTTFAIRLPALALRDLEADTHIRTRKQTTPDPRALRILVAEDNASLGRSLRRLLEQEGHTVVVVDDGRGAVDRLRDHCPFDLILLDLNMPALGGEAAFDQIALRHPDVAVVFTGGSIDPERRRALLAKGAFGCLVKPFGPNALQEICERVAAELDAISATGIFDLEVPPRSDSEPLVG